jgi:hypothetical protein
LIAEMNGAGPWAAAFEKAKKMVANMTVEEMVGSCRVLIHGLGSVADSRGN